ncbi:MAG TPA: protein kinase [Gemmatimonadales bacterium]|nr:protein kinase [Gemmatimonadales bacterium]
MTDPVAALREGLRDRYALERELGRGGMATVWLAQDLRHDRPVALKLLHLHLAASLGPERFQREIRLAARLQHPHILTVLDSGEVGGRLWFTMPFVEGESLRDRLRRERQLPLDVALRIAVEAARGLAYAHQHGVVHRDIKPENILLTRDGSTLVADFGIARALSGGEADGRTGGRAEAALTETGLAIGTPAYMSPEQAAGDKTLDARTDQYSLGAVLYEMLAGEAPWTGGTAQAIAAKRLTEPPPSVRSVRPNIPAAVDDAIRRALAPVAADRFASLDQFAQALAGADSRTDARADGSAAPTIEAPGAGAAARPSARAPARPRIAAGSLTLGLLIGLGILFGWLRHREDAPETGGAKRLAVLPFENLGGADQEYFADGVTDEVRGKLTSLPGLQVTARSSSTQYKKSSKSPQEIGRELGVDWLLTGTVRWEQASGGSHVRVSPELIQVSTGSTKWQQPFDASLTDVFQVQAEMAGQVAQALDVALGTPQKAALAERPTANPAAYDAFLKAEALSQSVGTVVNLRPAIDLYERAVALDSGFAQAWTQLSRAQTLLYSNGTPTVEGKRRALEAAERALRLTPNHYQGYLALGDYYGSVVLDYPRALHEYESGLRLAPNNGLLLGGTALAEISVGRWEEALEHFRRAGALDPRSVTIARRTAHAYLRLRRYSEAITAADRSIALAPDNPGVLENKVMAYLGMGNLDKAREVVRTAGPTYDPTALATTFGNFYELYWVLPQEMQDLLLRLTPGAFDDRGTWAIIRTQLLHYRGDMAQVRIYADSARLAMEERIRNTPDDAQSYVFRGLALAYLGRKADAIADGEHAVKLVPVDDDAYFGPYLQHQLVRIYILVGEPDKAMDRLEPLLKMPYYLSPGWLRIDPNFDPLRANPRFRKLVEGTA